MDGAAARKITPDSVPGVDTVFSYEEAFSRNLGWLTEWEQQALRYKCVAIAGMGGVGGVHLLTLARFGIGAFNIADPDHFELANFNRQVGANVDTIGRSKVAVLAESARKINPEIRVSCFEHGVDEANIDAFLAGVDLYIDAIDFFVLDIRRKLTDRCQALGIPVINAAPLGMGTAFLVFRPGGMSFEAWFRLDGLSQEKQYVNYLLGMAPAALHRSYLADASRVDLAGRCGPSTPAACELCAGVAAVTAVKLLLGRGDVKAVPYYHQFDPYRGRLVVRKLRGGNRNLRQRLKIVAARRLAKRFSLRATASGPAPAPKTDIEKIIDLARWAPSGDNCQPWRFESVDDNNLIVRVQSTGDVYDYNDGEPTLLSAGFLLESLRIAASGVGQSSLWSYRGRSENTHRIAIEFVRQAGLRRDELLPYLTLRSVDRRGYWLTPLSAEQKGELTLALGDDLAIEWHETLAERWQAAKVNARATDIRLRIPEAFEIHRRIMDWQHNFSDRGIPGSTIGLDPVARRLTRWLMRDWQTMKFANRLSGTMLARLEMDLIPGLLCGAHFTIKAPVEEALGGRVIRLLAAGQHLQRFWLIATKLGLVLQPALAPLCFAHYGRANMPFSRDAKMQSKAASLAAEIDAQADGVIFRGRIGSPRARHQPARSVRRRWQDLMVQISDAEFASLPAAATRAD